MEPAGSEDSRCTKHECIQEWLIRDNRDGLLRGLGPLRPRHRWGGGSLTGRLHTVNHNVNHINFNDGQKLTKCYKVFV